jgi:hypothetical protein
MPAQHHHPVLPALSRMAPGDHYCGIYRSDDDHRRIVVDFVRLGAERNERMIYLVNLQTAGQLKLKLDEAGVDAEGLVSSGQLIILTAKDAYLKDGAFDPEKMIAVLEEETARALADGYTALRVTGEMTWALAGDPGSERLIDYEALLNEFYVRQPRCYAICQYDQRRFDAELLLDVLHTHPKVLVGQEGFDNESMYFVPPVKYLAPDRTGAVLETWLTNLSTNSEVERP